MSVNPQVFTQPSTTINDPVGLLWSYEFRRQNGILTSRLVEVKGQLKQRDQLTELLSKLLTNLIIIVASITTALAGGANGTEHHIRLLYRLLGQALALLHHHASNLGRGTQALMDCIAQLKALYDMPSTFLNFDGVNAAHSPSSALSAASDSTRGSPRASGQVRAGSTTQSENGNAHITPINEHQAFALKLSTVMQQEGRPLDEYFDAACDFRRDQIRLRQADDRLFIEAFLQGLDNGLYRRRLSHAIRKTGWYWTWLTHEVQYLILEQDYMDKQNFALEHVMQDGTFMWPDGTYKHRIVFLPPITEEDLTDSDEESVEK